jgi:serine/threonine-protein kinase
MAPEQRAGAALDGRVDQYAFCVSLFEALFGRHPEEVNVSAPAASGRVPSRVRSALERGLAADPGKRFPSLEALLDALGYDPARERRRARILALALASASLFALVAVGAYAIRARFDARRQAQLAQDVKEVEWFLRTAYLLPLHDVTREEQLVRSRMADIAARTSLGPLADYALGRGHLALHEDVAAREKLDRASAAGLDTPELHYARGIVLGRLYDQNLAGARQAGQGAWLERRIREIEHEFLAPALEELERSRGVQTGSPALLAGQIAYYRKDWERAIALAKETRTESPWLYEGAALEADALVARAAAAAGKEPDRAAADLVAAGRLYDQAIESARSDVRLYHARIKVWTAQARITNGRDQPMSVDPAAVEEWARRAVIVAPRSATTWELLASARYLEGASAQQRDGDPRELYHATVDAARRAVELDGNSSLAHRHWGVALFSEAWYLRNHALDFRPLARESLSHYERAAELEPRNPQAINGLGMGYFRMAQGLHEHGEDPLEMYRKAEAQFETAIRIAPENALFFNMLLSVYYARSNWVRSRGQSPAPWLPAVEEALAACLRVAPQTGHCNENASPFYTSIANHEIDSGGDPGPALARAVQLLGENPEGLREKQSALVWISFLRFKGALRDGRKAQEERAVLDRDLAVCLAADAHNWGCVQYQADAELLEGHPARALEIAFPQHLRDSTDDDMARAVAEADLRLGRLDDGLRAAASGLAFNPTHAKLLAVRGLLLLERAKLPGRAADAQAGRDSLRQAREINPLIVRQYGRPSDWGLL